MGSAFGSIAVIKGAKNIPRCDHTYPIHIVDISPYHPLVLALILSVTMMNHTILYMFALMPPAPLTAEIHTKRLEFAANYRFVRALKPPVHITLYEPFRLGDGIAYAFEKDIRQMDRWARTRQPFEIELKDYGFFEHNEHPVLFIDVVKSPHLTDLHRTFPLELRKHLDMEKRTSPYRPHITIGYRDITVAAFPAIKEEYSLKKFSASFTCASFFLWRHDGSNWQVLHEFRFGDPIAPPPTLF